MAYRCEPHPGQQLFVDQQAGQTLVLSRRSQPGQQHQASSSFTTGAWTQPPELWRSAQGQFIYLQSTQGKTLVQVHPDGLEVMANPAIVPPIERIPLELTDAMPSIPQHGSRNTTTSSAWSHSQSLHHHFCPSCGHPIRAMIDRFCAHCGQPLS
jgi:hypothetical protein